MRPSRYRQIKIWQTNLSLCLFSFPKFHVIMLVLLFANKEKDTPIVDPLVSGFEK